MEIDPLNPKKALDNSKRRLNIYILKIGEAGSLYWN
jgi:hypothetical protein